VKTQHTVEWQRLSANKRIPSSLGSAMRALIHCSGWTRTTGRRPQTFHTRGCMYQRRGGNVRAITVFVKTAIRSLQRCIRQRKPPDARKIERSLLSSAPGLVGGTEFSTVRFRGDRAKAAKLYDVHGGALRDDFLQKLAKSWNVPLTIAERVEQSHRDRAHVSILGRRRTRFPANRE
jgi:hypothetical protein